MRILMLSQWYDPIIGGEETHVRSLSHALTARGHEVAIATMAHPNRPSFEMDGDVRIHRLRATVQRMPLLFSSPGRQSAPPLPDPELARGIRRVLRRERPDVVHAHNWLVYSYFPVRDASVPLVLTLHDHSFVCGKKNLMYREGLCSGPGVAKCLQCAARHYGAAKGTATLAGLWAQHPITRRAVSCFVTVSQSVARGNGIVDSGVRHETIPNFLPDHLTFPRDPALPAQGLPEAPYVLFVGSLSRSKGVDVLLRAHRRLPSAERPPLVLIGYRGTEQIASLQSLAPDERVLFDQPYETVLAAWQGSLCGAVPSVCAEAFGMVALEAMAAGRPVIASRVGGLPEVVLDGETGLLVEPGSVTGLSSAIDRLATDGVLRARLGQGGRARSDQFRASVVVPMIEGVYRRERDRLRPERTTSAS
jgi:glycosyltransferase involved in cell wall biosynthesis